jgi:serine protease AprX
VTLLALLAMTAGPAAAQARGPDKFDSLTRQRAHQLTGRTRVIVEFHGAADVRVLGPGARRRLATRVQAAEVENRTLASLAADPRVKRVMLDRLAFPTLERTGAAIGATLVREQLGLTGNGIGVAVIDSGIAASHEDLDGSFRTTRERVVHFKDFTRQPNTRLWMSAVASDEFGHGTHVAGIIAGSGDASSGRRTGVAPGAHLVGLKVLDASGEGYISDVIAAIDYAVSVRSTYNIRIINLSVAAGVFDSYRVDPLAQAARRAVDAGIVVVAAAGNLGRNDAGETQFGGITSPGNAPWVLTVGASSHQGTIRRSDDSLAGFSSLGPTWIDFGAKPDLVAPGVGIESLAAPQSSLYSTLSDYLLPGTRTDGFRPYLSMSGTSMAAPVVAGTVALMLEANPRLTPNAVKAILQYTAQAGRAEDVLAQGAGLLNARGAVRLARFFAAPQRGIGSMRDTIDGESIRWARHIVWGNYLVTGGLPLPGSNAWAQNLPWGALKTSTGTPVVWGARDDENIVWSTSDGNIVWSTGGDENIVWSTDDDSNIVWSTNDDGNIVWSTGGDNNIVWSTAIARNVVWGRDCGGRNCARVVWGARTGSTVWGTLHGDENIVWSTYADENIVWSTGGDENIVWSTGEDGNIVWSTSDDWNIVWSTAAGKNIVWSTGRDENIVWSTGKDENIVWSTGGDENIVWSTGVADQVLWPVSRSVGVK